MNEDSSFDIRGWKSSPSRWRELRDPARRMRKEPTPAEARLWEALRLQRSGARFRRQHAIGQFIVDFYCANANLVIEVDGPVHETQSAEDEARQQWLEANGLVVLRITNEDVLDRIESTLALIQSAMHRIAERSEGT